MPQYPTTQTRQLSTGRSLSFAIYGEKTAPPVYYMHGLYGSRFEALLAAEAAEKCGIQLIAADRPGAGESAPEPSRSLKSWAGNIVELADHLGHQQFSLLGVSGGAPYALSCAFYHPARVQRIALCGGLASLTDRSLIQKLPLKYKAALWLHHHFEPGLKWTNHRLCYSARKSPERLLRRISRHLSIEDKNILAESSIREIFITSLTEAAKQGPLYGEQELTIFGSCWNFSLADISTPVDIWHGDRDRVVPVAMAHHFAEKLQHSTLHIMPDEGHFSLPIRHAEQILQRLLNS